MQTAALQFSSVDPLGWRDQMMTSGASEAERLDSASREFEAVLLRHYLNEALKPITNSDSLFNASNPVYGYLVTDSLASGLSSAGVFGFSSVLQAQISGGLTGKEDHEHDI